MKSIRSWLYLGAKLLGDVNAVRRGKITRRAGRRSVGKVFGRILNRLFK